MKLQTYRAYRENGTHLDFDAFNAADAKRYAGRLADKFTRLEPVKKPEPASNKRKPGTVDVVLIAACGCEITVKVPKARKEGG